MKAVTYRAGAAAVILAASALVPGPARALGESSGATSYRVHCASCHGAALEGGAGPALKGAGFLASWSAHPSTLLRLINSTMPLNAPGSLTGAQYRRIAQYVLAANGIATGTTVASRRPSRAAVENADVEAEPGAPRVYAAASSRAPGDEELLHPAPGDWLHYNRDLQGERYSPLTQITRDNAAELVPECIFQAGEIGSFQASPLAWFGRLYVTTTNATFALDGATCRVLWAHRYRPTGPEPLPVNRGIALYEGTVIRGTADGYLIALDAMTGRLLWKVNVIHSRSGGFVNAAPVVFDGKVFVGVGCGDLGVMGRVYAFDARTGHHLWTFDVIPKERRQRRPSWGTDPHPAGGAVWSTITIDPYTRSLYVSTGNPAPDFDGSGRPGNNLYTDSVVVLDADTGRLRWFVQQVPHDTHDWDTAAAPMLYEQGGRKLMAVGSKDAYLYLYEGETHGLIAKVDLARRRRNDSAPLSATKKSHICPGVLGGVEWNGPAYDPPDGLIFINSVDWCGSLQADPPGDPKDILGGTYAIDPTAEARGSLHALDGATGAQKWVYWASAPMLAAITTTASGLVLTGTGGGRFLVLDGRSGRTLYRFDTGGAVAGGISTYLAAGVEHIAVLSGNSSKSIWRNTGSPMLLVFGVRSRQ